jgi:hypothetical protein
MRVDPAGHRAVSFRQTALPHRNHRARALLRSVAAGQPFVTALCHRVDVANTGSTSRTAIDPSARRARPRAAVHDPPTLETAVAPNQALRGDGAGPPRRPTAMTEIRQSQAYVLLVSNLGSLRASDAKTTASPRDRWSVGPTLCWISASTRSKAGLRSAAATGTSRAMSAFATALLPTSRRSVIGSGKMLALRLDGGLLPATPSAPQLAPEAGSRDPAGAAQVGIATDPLSRNTRHQTGDPWRDETSAPSSSSRSGSRALMAVRATKQKRAESTWLPVRASPVRRHG